MKKHYSKVIMAAAFAFVCGCGVNNAQAVVDMDAGTGTASFASEIDVAAAGTTLLNTGNILDIDVKFGFSIGSGTSKYVRVEVTNAVFAAALASADFSDNTGNANTYTISQGGAVDDNYAVVEVSAAADIPQDAILTVGLPDLEVTSQSTVTVTYAMFETAVDAVNGTNQLSGVSNVSLLKFESGHSVTAVDVTPGKIDVTSGSVNFVAVGGQSDEDNNLIGDPAIVDVAGNQYVTDGATDYSVDTALHVASATLVLSGDFTATQDLDSSGVPAGTYTPANVWISPVPNNCTGGPAGTAADTLTADTATFDLAATNISIAAGTGICMHVNGVSQIAKGSYTAVFTPTNGTGYDATASTITLSSLEKNGSKATQNFALTPGGTFNNWVRISNTSNISGEVFLRLYLDDGTVSSTFKLSDVDASFSDTLDAQASTPQMTIQKLYDASGLAAGYTGKLRVEAEGEFSSIDMQVFTVALDGSTFNTF